MLPTYRELLERRRMPASDANTRTSSWIGDHPGPSPRIKQFPVRVARHCDAARTRKARHCVDVAVNNPQHHRVTQKREQKYNRNCVKMGFDDG
jgi:hypothetical protein